MLLTSRRALPSPQLVPQRSRKPSGTPSRTGNGDRGMSDRTSRSQRNRSAVSVPNRSRSTPLKARSHNSSVKPLPSAMPMPAWLKLLKKTEQASLMLTSLFVTGAVFTYGWSMYSQQQWGKEYQRLDHLRLNERQLSTSSEWIKNDIARKNDPKSHGLVPRTRDSIVVIPPAPIRPPLPMRTPGSDAMKKNITPVGY